MFVALNSNPNCNISEFRMPPPEEDCLVQASINGNNLDHARHQVTEMYAGKLSGIRSISPPRAAEIDKIYQTWINAGDEWHEAINETHSGIELFCDEAIKYAGLKHNLHIVKNGFDQAKVALDDVESPLSAEDYARIQNLLRWSPSKIESLTSQLKDSEGRLAEMEIATTFSFAAISNLLVERAKFNPDIRHLVSFFSK